MIDNAVRLPVTLALPELLTVKVFALSPAPVFLTLNVSDATIIVLSVPLSIPKTLILAPPVVLFAL